MSIGKKPIIRKSPANLEIMQKAGQMLSLVFDAIKDRIQPGVTDTEIDKLARNLIESVGAKPAFLGYRGFPGTICCSIDEEIVHGIPIGRVLEEGSIVGIDIGLSWKGFFADRACTYPVGQVDAAATALMKVTEEALWQGIDKMRPGNRVGDVGAAIQAHVEPHGYGIVREYTGHGIGRSLHEAPDCPNFGLAGTGDRLAPGVVIAIEPMINTGSEGSRVLDDHWTVVTDDGGLSAHFEHTVAVTEGDPLVLTL